MSDNLVKLKLNGKFLAVEVSPFHIIITCKNPGVRN